VATNPTAPVLELVERTGLVLEREGLPRMAGRVLGCLLVADPPRQSIAQLMEALDASNGSISTMTRLLEEQGYIERVGVPGERRDYFALRHGGWGRVLEGATRTLAALADVIARAQALAPAASQTDLREAQAFLAFLTERLPALGAEWAAQRGERGPRKGKGKGKDESGGKRKRRRAGESKRR
jgi:DNA-binding transcriptional regulator GbsR (MarR family)